MKQIQCKKVFVKSDKKKKSFILRRYIGDIYLIRYSSISPTAVRFYWERSWMLPRRIYRQENIYFGEENIFEPRLQRKLSSSTRKLILFL